MKPPGAAEYLSTAQVAAALGIGVSTVKRWVEDGVLPAAKTAGGHRKLLLADVLEVARRMNLPVRDLARLSAGAANSSKPQQLAADLYAALRRGDASRVRVLVHGAYRGGVAIERLGDEIIAPAMRRIGHDWETGAIDVMHEHRASQACISTLYELKQVLESSAKQRRPIAVGGAPQGDLSAIPSLLSQMVLIDAGWDAVNLGPDTPLASLRHAVDELHPQLVWLSVSHGVGEPFLRDYGALYRHVESTGAALIVGGRALDESLRTSMPYTAYGDGLTHLAAFARSLHARPQRPRRGRPPQS